MARSNRIAIQFLTRYALAGVLSATLLLGISPLSQAQAGQTGRASGFPTTMPALEPARPLHLPAITEKTLANGLRIEVLEDHSQPGVWIQFVVPAGSIRDPSERAGLAELTASMLDKGTTTRTEAQIADTVDGLGASLGASATPDSTTISANGLSSYTSTLLELVADIALRPTFPNEEFERQRTILENGATVALGQPSALADAALSRVVYGMHPYGNFASGTPRSLPTITQQDVERFHTQYFAPNGTTLFVVGDVRAAGIATQVETLFGSWARKSLPPLPAPPRASTAGRDTPRIMLVDRPGSAQTEVRIGALVGGRRDPKRFIALVASAVLGLGQFDSRLTQEIRVKRGLTYGAASEFDRNADTGKWEITTFTKTASTGQVVKIAMTEAAGMVSAPTPAPELQARKDFLTGSFAVSVATPTGVLSRLVPAVLYGNGPDDLTKYVSRIEAVTAPEIQQVMRDLNVKAPWIVLVGDAAQVETQVATLGKVTRIPAAALDLDQANLAAPKQAGADAAGTPEELAEGKKRLATAIAAMGGDAFLNARSAVLKGAGELTPPGGGATVPISPVTLTLAAPDRSRIDMTAPGIGILTFTSPGGKAAPWLSLGGNVQDAPAGLGSPDPFGPLRNAARGNMPVRAIPDSAKPMTDTDGKPLHGFSVALADGVVARFYARDDTGVIARFTIHSASGDVNVLMGGYRAVQGVQLPGSLRVSTGDTTLINLTFDKVDVNKPVDDTFFARPKS